MKINRKNTHCVCPWNTLTRSAESRKSHNRKVMSLDEVTTRRCDGWARTSLSSWSWPTNADTEWHQHGLRGKSLMRPIMSEQRSHSCSQKYLGWVQAGRGILHLRLAAQGRCELQLSSACALLWVPLWVKKLNSVSDLSKRRWEPPAYSGIHLSYWRPCPSDTTKKSKSNDNLSKAWSIPAKHLHMKKNKSNDLYQLNTYVWRRTKAMTVCPEHNSYQVNTFYILSPPPKKKQKTNNNPKTKQQQQHNSTYRR